MRIEATHEGPASPEQVQARLTVGGDWGWTGAVVQPAERGMWLRYDRPVRVAVRIQVDPLEGGCGLGLVEGDLSELVGTIEVQPAGEGGSRVRLELDLAFPVVVPGTLLRELDGRVAQGWLEALVAQTSAADQ